MPFGSAYRPDPAFLRLGDGFADPVTAADFPAHILRYRNDGAATQIGLDTLSDAEWTRHLAGFEPLPDNLPEPLAMRYHGHQFRSYNPDLGDGRGFLFAQMRDRAGRLMDLGTKGSGTTPYSRFGDGRLTLKGAVREILAAEMLESLGAHVSRVLSVVETGEHLTRHDEPSPTRSAVMVRLNHGHIRIGTFQRHAFFSETDKLEKLVDFSLETYFGETPQGDAAARACRLLALVADRVAHQAADLMATGFVHGVLNTDNINITGEIFDFGPWRFLPEMNLTFTAAYFDETGLYAFGRQADALHWNIYQLAGALVDLAGEDALKDVLAPFPKTYVAALKKALFHRLGLKPFGTERDDAMLGALNDFMIEGKIPFERFFFDWYGGALSADRAQHSPIADQYETDRFKALEPHLLAAEPKRRDALDQPYFNATGPETLLIDEVEALWAAIDRDDDWQPLNHKLDRIRAMGAALGHR
ncbi:protein adenylyltransferase SelO family protein [Yunchengibacter salinarum]|uniref:protein adenylyltransferase SelO family protein n=1 Tax=Yunchengibacter salinarum TaxID=3133399 RepID=UPI0035B654DA